VPDLSLLENATKMIAKHVKSGDVVIYESTVYPGVTKRLVNDILRQNTNSIPIAELTIGYSPERINPGDREHTLKNINKLVGCDDVQGRKKIQALYQSIIDADVVTCESIEIAEAAKIIENIQRDVNIALMNELKIIFDKMNIDFEKVLSAASTKWNFLNFKPGLVGGHCIGIDPYYLAYLARSLNYNPEMILSGRRINDTMAQYLATKFVKDLAQRDLELTKSKVLICGYTFKPDCGDIRNTKVLDLIAELKSYGIEIDVFDPIIECEVNNSIQGVNYIENEDALDLKKYDVLLLAVRHSCFVDLLETISQHEANILIYDLMHGFIS
jgi:UDP-N-acetyl-D-galactosamine dehydrogenase